MRSLLKPSNIHWKPGLVFIAAALVAIPSGAQEGFPLDGTWRGEWGAPASAPNQVVIVMKWNGETVTGRINPGPNSIDFASARLVASDWGVHIEAESADGQRIRIDGTLEDIGSYNRRVVGTWQQGEATYNFHITRE
jgi:hypothetical protein